VKKHKDRRREPDPDAPRNAFRLKAWERWADDWDDELDLDEDEEDEDWERTLGRVDLWGAHWSEEDSSQAGRWRRAGEEGDPSRRSA
tara:strand:+ start:138 stop:398 length:261 start_codon:yes stop_codon:yes gene_type:complete